MPLSIQPITASYTHRPPRDRSSTSRRILIEAFLHRIRQLPPPLGLLVGRDCSHVLVIVIAGVFERGDEELERGVVIDGVVGDVVTGEGGEDAGPHVCVEGLVFLYAIRFELYRSDQRPRWGGEGNLP